MTMQLQLTKEIRDFLEAHASTKADYDPDFHSFRYNSPDATSLHQAAEIISDGSLVRVHSSWTHGGYVADGDEQEAKGWHNTILQKIRQHGNVPANIEDATSDQKQVILQQIHDLNQEKPADKMLMPESVLKFASNKKYDVLFSHVREIINVGEQEQGPDAEFLWARTFQTYTCEY